ncbi:MAG TPA: efflux RND transporter permease subunit [Phenylobacterium sp.]
MTLSDISVRRPVFAAVAAIILCVVGLASFSALTVRELPSVDPPVVGISTTYRGASAEVIEERITEVIERQVAGIEGIDRVQSSSRDGASRINISFKLTRDLDAAANDVRDAVSRVTAQLPEQADPPQIQKANADAAPIMFLNFSSQTMNRMQLSDYAQRYLVERLSTVPGVATVGIAGAQNYSMRIWLNPEAMASRGITVEDVENTLSSQNAELPAGSLEAPAKDFTIRVARGYATPEQFARMPIATSRSAATQASAVLGGNAATAGAAQGATRDITPAAAGQGYITRLGDIARVEEGPDERRRLFRSNGKDMIGIAVTRQSQANDLEISDGVRAAITEINATLPKGTRLGISVDYTEFTRHAIQEVWITMAISLGCVALVNFLFLGTWRAAMIPSIVAPICILSTFIVLAPLGFSINLLTLLALVLAIGLVVDDAIVVVENIQRRIDEGEPPIVAAQRGARQVFFAVVATTIVLISVFAPLMFLPGFIGRLFVELAVSVAAAVGFSALLALSLSPMLASKLLRPAQGEGWLARRVDSAMHRLKTSYHASLESILGRRSVSIGASSLVVILAVCAYGMFSVLPRELTPEEDRRRAQLQFSGPEGAGFDYTLAASRQVEKILTKYLNEGVLERYVFAMPRFGSSSYNQGGGNVILSDKTKVTAPELAARLNRELSSITAVRSIVSPEGGLQRGGPGGSGGGGGTSLQLIATGADYPEIARWIQPVLAAANGNPGLARPRLDYEPTSPRLIVNIDREQAAALGVPAQTIGRALETQFGSRRVTTYIKNGQEYDVLLQTDRAHRQTEQDLAKLYVRTASGEAVPLTSVVTTQVRGDTPDRPRVDRLRSISLSAQLNPGYTMGEAIQFFRDEAAKQTGAVTVKWGGGARDYLEASGSVGLAFGMALLLVFLVLAAQFESWIHPAVIMLTVPVAAVGGLFGLLIVDSSINTYSQIGLIILVGIAAKNGILIVEFANQLRDEGLSIREAVIESASLRLRPIIMTSISAAAGAIPLIVWGGAGGEARKTIGVTIFFGAIFATLVTLFIVPVFYNLLARFTKSPMATARRIEAFEEAEKGRVANAAE